MKEDEETEEEDKQKRVKWKEVKWSQNKEIPRPISGLDLPSPCGCYYQKQWMNYLINLTI